jgi:hypothetical protein
MTSFKPTQHERRPSSKAERTFGWVRHGAIAYAPKENAITRRNGPATHILVA